MEDGFIYFENEKRPRYVYTPYVYSSIVDCSKHYTIFTRGTVKIIDKEVLKNVAKRRHNCI